MISITNHRHYSQRRKIYYDVLCNVLLKCIMICIISIIIIMYYDFALARCTSELVQTLRKHFFKSHD